jgi:hypothetical protein
VRSDRPDGDRVEHFLVDGVAPAVIGGGPPESPFELAPDPEPEPPARGRHHAPVAQPRKEPPTSPIPVIHQLPDEPVRDKRKSWVARMFRPD